jgi:hypothetical protein
MLETTIMLSKSNCTASASSSDDTSTIPKTTQQSTPLRRRRLYGASCCWPLSSPHWYKPVVPVRPDVVLTHTMCHSMSGCCCAARSTRTAVRSWIQYVVLILVLLILVLWWGVELEQYQVRIASDTTSFYNQQSAVCGMIIATNTTTNNNNENISTTTIASDEHQVVTSSSSSSSSILLDSPFFRIESFSSAQALNETAAATDGHQQVVTAHCGDCGACSTPHDIDIYDRTSNSLLKSSTKCAKRALIWGRKTATTCMEESVGFTADCNDCWVENIMCDLRRCVFTCLWYGLFRAIDGDATGTSGTTTTLNPCTTCDEKRCGPAFIQCAGANRRRTGILSDIERDSVSEVCTAVSPKEWWKDPNVQHQWQLVQEEEEDMESLSTDDTK